VHQSALSTGSPISARHYFFAPLAALRHWATGHLDDVVLAQKAHEVNDGDAAAQL
jgi:hypothetical protein